MDIFKAYAVDETKEETGTWMEIGDAGFLIARAGNRKYIKLLSKEVERNQKALDCKDKAADELSDKIMVDVIARTILLDWKNVQYQDKALEYSVDNAKMLLAHKDFRREVMRLADDFSAYKLAKDEEDEKN